MVQSPDNLKSFKKLIEDVSFWDNLIKVHYLNNKFIFKSNESKNNSVKSPEITKKLTELKILSSPDNQNNDTSLARVLRSRKKVFEFEFVSI